jgi:hypothetical protein
MCGSKKAGLLRKSVPIDIPGALFDTTQRGRRPSNHFGRFRTVRGEDLLQIGRQAPHEAGATKMAHSSTWAPPRGGCRPPRRHPYP